MLLFLSSMMNGQHDASQLPAILVGGGGGRIKAAECSIIAIRPIARCAGCISRCWINLGVRPARFGDANQPLNEL